MKNVRESELLKCFWKHSADFDEDISQAMDMDLDFGFDDGRPVITNADTDEELDYETVLEKLSAYYDVTVTSFERVGDWHESYVYVFYKEE